MLFRSSSDIVDGAGHVLVTAYTLQRPDGDWSLMIVNKDQLNAHPVRIAFENEENNKVGHLTGSVSVVTFGSEQYKWHSDSGNPIGGVADPDGPLARFSKTAEADSTFILPKASVTVVRGKIAVP